MTQIVSRNKWIWDRLRKDFPEPDYEVRAESYDLGNAFGISVSRKNGSDYIVRHAIAVERLIDGKPRGLIYSDDKERDYQSVVKEFKRALGGQIG